MLLWINGPFGGGKTQTAYEIQRRLPGSVVCDPEHVGFGLRRMMPAELRGDFQDLEAWRAGVHEVLDVTLSKYPGTVIAPMTLVEPAYFREIVGGLRDAGHDVRHFALLARRETVLRRLRERGLGQVMQYITGKEGALTRESWAVGQLDRCLEALGGEEFREHVWTDHMPVQSVADRVAAAAGLRLRPNTDGPLLGGARRAWTGVKHIRLD